MIIEKKHVGHFTILYVEGLIKVGESADFFASSLETVLEQELTSVIVDLSKIDYIDSTGVGKLVGFLGRFTAQSRQLILVNPSERIVNLLSLAQLDTSFPIYASEDDAIAAGGR